MRPEVELPVLSLEQRLSFTLNYILTGLEFEYRPELELQIREKQVQLDGERSVHTSQSRISDNDKNIFNIVQFMAPMQAGITRNQLASWYTGDTVFCDYTFSHTDDIELVLQDAKRAVADNGEA